MKTATKSKTKTTSISTKTIQKQTFNILQNVFECSIAGICKDRNLFPMHFFQDFETDDDNRLRVTKFDLDYLLLDDDDDDNDENDSDDNHSYHNNDDDVMDQDDDDNDRKYLKNKHLPSLSPLTLQSGVNSISSTLHHHYDHNQQRETEISNHQNHNNECNEKDSTKRRRQQQQQQLSNHQRRCYNNRYYKNEALLLLHWIKHGVMEIMKQNRLDKFIFAICIPSSSTPIPLSSSLSSTSSTTSSVLVSSNQGSNQDDTYNQLKRKRLDRSHDNHHDTMKQYKKQRIQQNDEIIETYVFDMSQFNVKTDNTLDKETNTNETKKKKKAKRSMKKTTNHKTIDHRHMQDQYDSLFRNLQMYSRSITSNNHSVVTEGGQQCQFGSFMSHEPTHEINNAVIPMSRYFNIRVEFKNHHNVADGDDYLCSLPIALDPYSSINTLFARSSRIPSIAKSLHSLLRLPLGKVVEENVTGLGVKVIACHRNDEDHNDDYDKFDEDNQNHIEDSLQMFDDETRSNNKLVVPSLQAKTEMKNSTSTTSYTYETQTNNHIPALSQTTYQKGRQVFAVPHYNPCLKSAIKRNEPSRNSSSLGSYCYLPCTVLDTRIRKECYLDYKVQFVDPILNQAKMKKQWIASSKVMTLEKMKENIFKEIRLEMYGSGYDDDNDDERHTNYNMTITLSKTQTTRICEKLRLQFKTLYSLIRSEYQPSTIKIDMSESSISDFKYDDEKQMHNSRTNIKSTDTTTRYCYAMKPISVLL